LGRPAALIFDVNETLIDIRSLEPLFARLFGDPLVLREWFNQLILYSMTISICRLYEDFFSLGGEVLMMVAAVHRRPLTQSDVDALFRELRSMPPHPDVAPGLRRLRAAGIRLISLTNSPHKQGTTTPLENAGLGTLFDRQFTVDSLRTFKPDPSTYQMVASEMALSPDSCCMVAAHPWDTIGAQSVGMRAALITRPGNSPLLSPRIPQPDWIADDLQDLANQLLEP
jgi:2-haloacid dehalogenase